MFRILLAGALLTLPAPVAVEDTWTAPLRTEGRYIVDADGDRFRLVAGNWHGASGTTTGDGDHAGEVANQMPLGLDRAPIRAILDGFHTLGLNSIRLPFSNQMIHDTRPVPDHAVAANPQLKGKTPIQVYDAVVAALTADGFAVFLNNHTTTSRWCCGVDGNERWNTSQSTATWEADWLAMVRRYTGNPRVVGADLYNEVRRNVIDDPNWGWGNDHDWQAASARLADRILLEANPRLLIVVEGINWTGIPIDGFAHGRPDLTPARHLSHTLVSSDKLVWGAHFYGYTGPHHSGATGIGETTDPRYRDMTPQKLAETLYQQAFFATGDPSSHYTHPVWISEFGVGGNSDGKDRAWFDAFTAELVKHDADFAYWPLMGWTERRQGNGWALLHFAADGTMTGLDGWRLPLWQRLVTATGRTGTIPATPRWNMLSTDHSDHVASARVRAAGDFDPGARKAVCPDDQLLAGMSRTGGRGLCLGPATPGTTRTVVRDERHVTTDWARDWTKLQCPPGNAAIGYAVKGRHLNSVLCAPAPVTTDHKTVWFDKGDNRPAADRNGGDFANGHYKGQCPDQHVVAGVAYSSKWWSPDREPDALYCVRQP